MAVGAHIGAGLEHVQEPLDLIRFGVEVVIEATARGLTGLSGHRIEQGLIKAADRIIRGGVHHKAGGTRAHPGDECGRVPHPGSAGIGPNSLPLLGWLQS
jgi:hypothetical protein